MDSGRKTASSSRVGRYDVLLRIASGGMATVYLARASGAAGFEREVALKVTHPHLAEDPDLSHQLLEEAKLSVAIRHANVVPVLDVGEEDGILFLVMEYVEGDTLGGLMRASRGHSLRDPQRTTPASGLQPRIFLRILIDALAGLHAAHDLPDAEGREQNLVHRDFSPQNILVGTDGIARLTDFGIAKVSSRKATSVGIVKGKVNYMSPEQAMGRPIDRRTDVWAAGVIAWEAFTGRRLYQGADEFTTLAQIVKTDPPLLRTVNAEIHPAIEAAVAHALKLDRDERTPTAAAFAKELLTAVRLASIDLAEPADVAAVVKELAGAKLAERRKQARLALSGAPSSSSPSSSKEPPASAAPPSSGSRQAPQSSERARRAVKAAPRVGLSQPPPPRPERTRSFRVGQALPVDLRSLDALLAPLRRDDRVSPTPDQQPTDTTSVAASPERPHGRSYIGLVALLAMSLVVATIAAAAVTKQIKRSQVADAGAASSLEPTVAASPPGIVMAPPPSSPAPSTRSSSASSASSGSNASNASNASSRGVGSAPPSARPAASYRTPGMNR